MAHGESLTGDARTLRSLPGLSGAQVLLMTKDDRHWFVRKIARDPEGNARLRRQVEKQLAFARSTDVVRTPRVLEQGEVDGRYFVDMEFVRGSDGVTYLRRASYADVTALADRFCAYLRTIASQPPDQPSTSTLFEALYGKLCEVQRKTSLIDSGALSRLFLGLERLRVLSHGLSPTRCHGDLTLENLVIDEQREVWMLDFLDAPFEHYWQDIAKLHQDLEGGWYLRQQGSIARCVLEYISGRLTECATGLDASYPEIHPLLLACTFVRILPYVRTEDERELVMQRIDYFARLAHGETAP